MQTVVGVLRGGSSREHNISLKTGAAMVANLPEEKYAVRDIYIDTSGQWHDRGRPAAPERILRQLDTVLIGLHGEAGVDGSAQRYLERFAVPYAGADSFGSYLSSHKALAKVHAQQAGILTPESHFIERAEDGIEGASIAIRRFNQPVVVKPVGWGSSIGVSIVGGYAPVLNAIEQLFTTGAKGVLVEERIEGREATVGVVEGLRGEALYVLPSVEIVSPRKSFHSYEAKYSGAARHICPGRFSRTISEELGRAAKLMHRVLGLRHYSRSDFIVAPNGVYYLETNSFPSLAPDAPLARSLAAVGVPLRDFFTHLVDLTLGRSYARAA